MAIKLNKLYFILIFLLGIVDLFAGPGGSGPPAPTSRNPSPPPGEPPPSVSIDQFMVLALVLTVFFGMYIIVKNKKIKTL